MGQPPKVNPKFADFVCIPNVSQLPWVNPFDIGKDGNFGVDDLKAFIRSPEDFPLDRDEERLNVACRKAKIRFVENEVRWKVRDLLARQSWESRHSTSLFQDLGELRDVALRRIQDVDSKEEFAISVESRDRIVEMYLRARLIVSGERSEESFGVGIGLVLKVKSPAVLEAEIVNVIPSSSAARAGVRAGDVLSAIDDLPLKEWSRDGTIAGLDDPETGLVRGLGGERGSKVKVTVQRGEQKSDFILERNVWSGRTLSGGKGFLWDGAEHPLPPLFPKNTDAGTHSSSPSSDSFFSCGADPGAKP